VTLKATSDGRAVDSIERSACLAQLGDGRMGRLAVSIGAVPAGFPVNDAMLDGHAVFETAGATCLQATTSNPLCHEGWSVLVVGTADEITDDARRARAHELLLRPHLPTSAKLVMAMSPELGSRRRVALMPEGLGRTG
jgi:hypothetical protein